MKVDILQELKNHFRKPDQEYSDTAVTFVGNDAWLIVGPLGYKIAWIEFPSRAEWEWNAINPVLLTPYFEMQLPRTHYKTIPPGTRIPIVYFDNKHVYASFMSFVPARFMPVNITPVSVTLIWCLGLVFRTEESRLHTQVKRLPF